LLSEPWWVPLITNPTNNDLDRNHGFITWITDPPNIIKRVTMDLEQRFGALDPMPKGYLGIVHLIEEPLRCVIVCHALSPP
jgi:hypothetical protein